MDTIAAGIMVVAKIPELTVPTMIKYIRKHPIVNTTAKHIVSPIKMENAIKTDTTTKTLTLSLSHDNALLLIV